MTHKGTVVLETERLALRQFKIKDAQKMFDNWASSANVTKFLTWKPHKNTEETKTIINNWIKGYEKDNYYQWAIELKEIGEPIGSISIVHIHDNINEVEIGYCIGEKWWHQGYTSEALRRVIDFLFDEVGAKRICSLHDIDNPNSGRVMLKCGLEKEGILRKSGRNNTNAICDLAVYSILNY